MAAPGDLDGDGQPDLVVGDERSGVAGTGSGEVVLFWGPLSGYLTSADIGASIRGLEPYDHLGQSLSGVADADGDGMPDLWIGADDLSAIGCNGGAVLFLGPITGGMSAADADLVLCGGLTATPGYGVADAGDIDGDGLDDLLAGDPTHGNGAAWLLLDARKSFVGPSSADAIFDGTAGSAGTGYAQAGPGDMDGDGYGEVAIGAYRGSNGYTTPGATYVVHGPITGTLALEDADLTVTGEVDENYAGFSLSAAGDVDADGLPDLLIGAPKNGSKARNGGAVYLIRGGQAW